MTLFFCFFCGMNCVFFLGGFFLWYELCVFFVLFFVVWIVFFFVFFCGMNCVFVFFCGMNCVFFCVFFVLLWYAFFVVWIVFFLWYELCFFLCFFLWYELWFFLCFFLWYELCFFAFICGMNCFFCFFLWYELFFFLCFYLWYELCFFLCFFLWYELLFFLCFFLWYELCFFFRAFFCAFFLCSGAPEKHKKKHKKKSTKTPAFLWKKWISGLLPSTAFGPAAQQMSHTISFFQPPFPKKLSGVSPCQERECEKNVMIILMFIENLNNYCWRHAFVTLFTYNLQWLDRLIAVSRYLRYAAFNIVKNVVIISYQKSMQHLASSYHIIAIAIWHTNIQIN